MPCKVKEFRVQIRGKKQQLHDKYLIRTGCIIGTATKSTIDLDRIVSQLENLFNKH